MQLNSINNASVSDTSLTSWTREEMEQKINEMLKARKRIAILTGFFYLFALGGISLFFRNSFSHVCAAQPTNSTASMANTTSLRTGYQKSHKLEISSGLTAASLLALVIVNGIALRHNNSLRELRLANLDGFLEATIIYIDIVGIFLAVCFTDRNERYTAMLVIASCVLISFVLESIASEFRKRFRPKIDSISSDIAGQVPHRIAIDNGLSNDEDHPEIQNQLLNNNDTLNSYGTTDGPGTFSGTTSSASC